ncbi:glycosyltransferase [Acaryochloris sp. IP29b_bin.148]|uniref:glycosyltransferase n=1 Tax=Acaryochloris sp. IP29b_bin.148 TaxID=2969218 RepID=UPI002630C4DC|nr:glycosyltransferase [Acaryochloris sp. IP29b_bin.148]
MVSVGVFIDLRWHQAAGGHVKCWESFAKVAATLPEELTLSLHFLGDQEQVIELSPNVRYVLHPPRFSTERLTFLKDVPGHTDIAPSNPSLIPYLEKLDIVHITHPQFTFGKTAKRYCQQQGKPLIASIHTDTPEYSRIYTEQALEKLFGQGWFNHLLSQQLQIPRRYKQLMVARQKRYWQSCAHVLTAQPSDFGVVNGVLPKSQISHLRRGIDKELFHPHHRDRSGLEQTYNIPPGKFLLLFVGRLDACKNILTFAQAVKILLDQGLPVHGLVVGQGSSDQEVQAILGDHVTLTGTIDHDQLGPIFASADLFVFPSQTETIGNVIVEAKASGLPVIISSHGGAYQSVQASGEDGIVIEDDLPETWAGAIATLYHDPDQLAQMKQATLAHIDQHWPTWLEVLQNDLLPVWQTVAAIPGRVTKRP